MCKLSRLFVVIAALLTLCPPLMAEDRNPLTFSASLSANQFRQCGLHKLTHTELKTLDSLIKASVTRQRQSPEKRASQESLSIPNGKSDTVGKRSRLDALASRALVEKYIHPDMTQDEVLHLLGRPQRVKGNSLGPNEVWTYYFNRIPNFVMIKFSRGRVEKYTLYL